MPDGIISRRSAASIAKTQSLMKPARADLAKARRKRRLAKEIRAARAYADFKRNDPTMLAALGIGHEQFGEYERGNWKRPPTAPVLAAMARVCEIPKAWLDAGFLQPDDPATRFADAVRREAEQPRERPRSASPDHLAEDDAGGAA